MTTVTSEIDFFMFCSLDTIILSHMQCSPVYEACQFDMAYNVLGSLMGKINVTRRMKCQWLF